MSKAEQNPKKTDKEAVNSFTWTDDVNTLFQVV